MGSVPIFILAAHILSMLGFATFAALLPELRDLWRLSNFEAGVIGGMFFTGYIATVSYWTALTDRYDGRKVYLARSLLAPAGSAGCGRACVCLCRAFAKTSFGREIFFLEDALSSRCLAPRDGQPAGGRLHARLRSALPRAVRLARLDGGISRLLLELSCE